MSQESNLDQLLKARAEIDEQLRRHQTHLTILFTDVVGSTAYFDRYGDIAGVAMMHRHAELASNAVAEFAGRVIKTIGDSVMAEFPEPLKAVRAAVEIQRRLLRMNETLPERDRLQLRIGLNHGPCFRYGTDVSGDAVNVAARVTKRTGPAQILVSHPVREAIPPGSDLRVNWLGQVTLSGKAEKEDIFEVVWTDTGTYADLRQHVTLALKRGDLMAPGLKLDDLVQSVPPPAEPSPGTPAARGEATADLRTPAPTSLETRYDLLGELGNGGMGVVYKARDRETGDLVALKVLRSEIAADVAGLTRFKNELRIARRITHKNICRIHEFNRTDSSAYISMEYVEGESLRQLIRRAGALAPEQGIPIARQICAGLAEAHAQGVVHRDLKPENVMIDPSGVVKVMDFGIARSTVGAGMTQTGAVVGTPAYMAPEQAEGTPLDHRADLYTLGLILYEMFTGTQAFRAETPVALLLKHIREHPTPPREFKPSLPEHLNLAILRCLAKKPADRFQSVEELAAALTGPATAVQPAISTPPAEPPTGETRLVPSQEWRIESLEAQDAEKIAVPPSAITPASPAQTAAAQRGMTQDVTPPTVRVTIPPPAERPGLAVSRNVLIGAFGAILATGLFAAVVLLKLWREPPRATQQTQTTTQIPAPVSSVPQPVGDTATAPAQPPESVPPVSEPATKLTAGTGATPATRLPAGEPAAHPPSRGTEPPPPPTSSIKTSPTPVPAVIAPVSLDFSLGRTLAGHTGAVSAVAFSPDGRWVASGSRDKSVRIWEAGSGQQVHLLKGHADAVSSVAFSADGRHLASASSDKTVRIWDTAGGSQVLALPKDSAFILSVAFHPSGLAVATATADGRIKLWELASSSPLRSMEGHSGPVYSVAFSADGEKLVSAGRDGTVRVWDTDSGQELRVFRGHADAVNAAVFSRDGRLVASASDDRTVKIWDAAAARELRSLAGHEGGVEAVVFSPDGRWIASGSADKTVKVWEVATGRDLRTLTGHLFSVSDLAASRDARWLASAAGDNTIRLWRRQP